MNHGAENNNLWQKKGSKEKSVSRFQRQFMTFLRLILSEFPLKYVLVAIRFNVEPSGISFSEDRSEKFLLLGCHNRGNFSHLSPKLRTV